VRPGHATATVAIRSKPIAPDCFQRGNQLNPVMTTKWFKLSKTSPIDPYNMSVSGRRQPLALAAVMDAPGLSVLKQVPSKEAKGCGQALLSAAFLQFANLVG
jgi:hypothetical protein